jgi:hypothetical protein
MAIIDRSANREYDLYGVQTVPLPKRGGTLLVRWGGSSRLSGWHAGSYASCADAACTPLADGLITYPELASGHINHALFLVVGCSNGRQVYPAADTGGACSQTADAPATGQWLQLNMSPREIAKLRAPAWEKAIYRALARYGGMIGDEGSNGGFEFMPESPQSYTSFGLANPFVAWAARHDRPGSHIDSYVAGGVIRYALTFAGPVNWRAHLRVIDPCVISGTC